MKSTKYMRGAISCVSGRSNGGGRLSDNATPERSCENFRIARREFESLSKTFF